MSRELNILIPGLSATTYRSRYLSSVSNLHFVKRRNAYFDRQPMITTSIDRKRKAYSVEARLNNQAMLLQHTWPCKCAYLQLRTDCSTTSLALDPSLHQLLPIVFRIFYWQQHLSFACVKSVSLPELDQTGAFALLWSVGVESYFVAPCLAYVQKEWCIRSTWQNAGYWRTEMLN